MHIIRLAAVAGLLFALAPAPLFAQSAAVRGRVTDTSGAAIAGAAISVRGPDGERTVRSSAVGEFGLADLTAGEYVIVAETRGFAPDGRTIILGGRDAWIDVVLQPAPLTETITVVPGRLAGTTVMVSVSGAG